LLPAGPTRDQSRPNGRIATRMISGSAKKVMLLLGRTVAAG
jgi:hypothetical protein